MTTSIPRNRPRGALGLGARWPLVALALALAAPAAAAGAKPNEKQVQKVIKTVVNAIRYDKDDVAAKHVGFEPMAKAIMRDAWNQLSEAERKELVAGVETLIRKLSFAKGRELFQHLDAILYGPIEAQGDRVVAKTTVVVHRNYKKTELVIDFVLTQDGGAWKIMDTIMAGESTADGIHEDQIVPLMKAGGTAEVMRALRDKLAEVS